MFDRTALSNEFLLASGWGGAHRAFLAGDASDRSYDRLTHSGESAVLMDAPPGKGDDPADFIRIASYLRNLGLSAPTVKAQDLSNGFLLLEDLGDDTYARLIGNDSGLSNTLYTAATDVLLHLQTKPAPTGLPNLTALDWAEAACFALDWYRFAATGEHISTTTFCDMLAEVLSRHADGPRAMILRDYHAENLLWLPERTGLARVGILDFQLAQMGQPGYDLVSLLQDARRDVPVDVESAMVQRFATATGASGFAASYAVLGAQRALRIIGIFTRLCLKGGKAGYLPLIPRVWGQLQRNLQHPTLKDMAKLCTQLLPEPTPETLSRIGEKCSHSP